MDDLYCAVAGSELAATLFFCSSRFDLAALTDGIAAHFSDVPVIGCTTAGEIGSAGYRHTTLVGVGLPASDFRVASVAIDDLCGFDEARARELAGEMFLAIGDPAGDCFSILLIDGLSGCEERVALFCQRALGDAPLVGGSAGDDQDFLATHVFHDGRFRRDAAVWLLVKTRLPFKVFRSTHFRANSEPLVVTAAEANQRIVREINGYPAVREYARAVGLSENALTADQFAAAPLVVRIAGNDYVRSIQHANPDGSLKLYCAIERGVVLHVGKALDLIGSRRALFDEIRASLGEPALTLGFDCIHCRLEAEKLDAQQAIEQLCIDNKVVGFSSYGEQFIGMHVNQTFTGVAIGRDGGS